jgi:SAM-dependent methyltransferase
MTKPAAATPESVYGSRDWLEQEYRRVGGDPWGLDWRPSQLERYHQMVDVVTSVPALQSQESRRVLDVGCATGTFTAMLASALGPGGAEVRGIDVADLAISRARARYPQIGFECLTLEEAETRFAETFDLITMLEVLYYVPEEERGAVLGRLRRMLRPGGIVVISSMVAQKPYMSPSQLRTIVGSRFRVVDSGVLTLRPMALLEKPLLRLTKVFNRFGSLKPRMTPPARGWAIPAAARLAHRLLGERAVSHSYVVAAAEG